MSVVRTNAAAVMLGVSPNTLRSWERRFAFPTPRRTPGGHRQYDLTEVEALRQALEETHNISSAISIARERGEGPSTATRLKAAFQRFDEQRADRLLEDSLAVRSVERTVEELLLPAVEALGDEEPPGPEYPFAWRHATGWLSAAQRLAPAASRGEGVLIFDASSAYEVDSLHVQALELMLRRGGLRTLTLDVALDPSRLSRALRALEPVACVLAGSQTTLDVLGRLVYAVRIGGRTVEILDYRGALPDTGHSTVMRLGERPLVARDLLLDRLAERDAAAEVAAPAPAAARAARLA